MRCLLLAILLSMPFLAGCSAFPKSDWKEAENKYFSFSIPDVLNKTDKHGIDSFVEAYEGNGIELHFDYEMYSETFNYWPVDTQYETLKIDGKSARIGTCKGTNKDHPYRTAVHINIKDHVSLTMYAICKSQHEVKLAKKIFKTIVFKQSHS